MLGVIPNQIVGGPVLPCRPQQEPPVLMLDQNGYGEAGRTFNIFRDIYRVVISPAAAPSIEQGCYGRMPSRIAAIEAICYAVTHVRNISESVYY